MVMPKYNIEIVLQEIEDLECDLASCKENSEFSAERLKELEYEIDNLENEKYEIEDEHKYDEARIEEIEAELTLLRGILSNLEAGKNMDSDDPDQTSFLE